MYQFTFFYFENLFCDKKTKNFFFEKKVAFNNQEKFMTPCYV